ncbi:hypothetical protein EDD17DRAFT_1755009 [Pisolithus thermaeus]|nr:hypothetical protein EV401DRAFT_2066318 [Pisolithus croceorrhizus]KAI6164488.1 hypothetical protein EDD17DRAFT_1755009 [Pisolithus thermaeus]
MIINFIKRMLGVRHGGQPMQLFSGCGAYSQTLQHTSTLVILAACFSKQVPSVIKQRWGTSTGTMPRKPRTQKVGSSAVTHGGEIYSPNSHSRTAYCFATDTADEWVIALTSQSVTVIHAGWIVHCVDSGFRVPVAKYVLDELFVPGPPYRVAHVLADSETRLQITEAPPDQTTDDSNTLIQLDTPSTPPPSVSGYKRKREPAYFDSPSGCYILSEFDKDGVPRRPRKLRKLRFEPSFTPKYDRLNNTPQLICHHHPSDDFNPFVTDVNASAKDRQADDRTVANVAAGRPPLLNSADQTSTSKAGGHETSAAPDHLSFSVDRIHCISPKQKPVRTIDFTRLPTAPRRSRFPGFDGRSDNPGQLLSINKLSDKIGATSNDAVINSNASDAAFSNARQMNDDKSARKITFASHALVRVYRDGSDSDGPQESNPKPPADTTLDANAGSTDQQRSGVDDRREAAEPPLSVSENCTEPSGEATKPCPKECSDITALAANGTQPKMSNLLSGTKSEVLALDVQQVLDFRKCLKSQRPECELPSGQLAMLFELGRGYRGMEFRREW